MTRSFAGRMRTYFITGLVVVLPVFLTLIILKWSLGKLSQWFLEPFVKWAMPYTVSFFPLLLIKAVMAFVIIVIIIGVGAAARLIIVRRFFTWGEGFLLKAPVINKIYAATKEISSALFGRQKGLFKKVVLVEFPRNGIFSVGFVTCEQIDKKIIKKRLEGEMVSVFVPTAPNPTSGFFTLVEKKDLIEIDINAETALKWILSVGALSKTEPAG